MPFYLLGRKFDGSQLLYDGTCIKSQKNVGGNIYLIFDENSKKGFLHTGKYFIDFVRVGFYDNNQCYLSRESDRFIYSVRPLGESEDEVVVVNRTRALGWETFDLISVPYSTRNISSEIDIIASLYFNTDNITAFNTVIESNLQDKSVILQKILAQVSRSEIDTLSRYYYDHPDELEKLAIISGDLLFIAASENTPLTISISEELDFIGDRKIIKSLSNNIWMNLIYHIRKLHKPTKKLCVVATAKNEGIYILEWISYYLSLGVDGIYIYSNGNDDGSSELLKALHNAGFIRYIENNVTIGCSAQNKAYTHALTINKEILNYEWSIFIDLDEFIVFNGHMFSSFIDFLDWHNKKDVHAIALNWIFSIPEKKSDWINTPIIERLSKFDKKANGCIKTVFKPHYFYSSFPHHPLSIDNAPFYYKTANGMQHIRSSKNNSLSISDKPSNTHAAILHYFNRSIPEFIWKYSRNRGDHPNMKDNGTFTESLLPFLKFFMSSIDKKDHDDIKSLIPNNIDITSSIKNILSNDSISDAYEKVKRQTASRYEVINSQFWDFLKEQRKHSEYVDDIDAFISRFH